MKPEYIPQELLDLLDERAGKRHSRKGKVVSALAEILTSYDEMPRGYATVMADREAELLELKGPCRFKACRLHYAHRGPCDTRSELNER